MSDDCVGTEAMNAPRRRWIHQAGGLVVILVAVGLLAGCGGGQEEGAAGGQEPRKPKAQDVRTATLEAYFSRVDANRDGAIDADERRTAIRRDFRDMDLNGDGVVSIEDVELELRRTGRPGAERRPGRLSAQLPYDDDGDGDITVAEYEARVEREIAGPMDADHDGRITLEEGQRLHSRGRLPGPEGGLALPLLLGVRGRRRLRSRLRASAVPVAGVGVTLLAVLVLAPQAQASAVYNLSDQGSGPHEISVLLHCGFFCISDWQIKPGASAARPGKGGEFYIARVDGNEQCEADSHPNLQSHGYAQFLLGNADRYIWQIFDSNGNRVGGDYGISFVAPFPYPSCEADRH